MRSIKFEFDIWTCNQKIGPNLFSGHYLLTISSTCVIEAGERSFHEASPLAVVRWTTRGVKVTNCSKAMSTKEHRRDKRTRTAGNCVVSTGDATGPLYMNQPNKVSDYQVMISTEFSMLAFRTSRHSLYSVVTLVITTHLQGHTKTVCTCVVEPRAKDMVT